VASIDFDSLKLAADVSGNSVDAVLETVSNKVIGAVNRRVISGNTDISTSTALDILSEQLLQYRAEAASKIETQASTVLSSANKAGRALLDKMGVSALSLASAEGMTKALNHPAVPDMITSLWSEVQGITDDTMAVFKRVKEAKQKISVVRQEYIESVPKNLFEKYSQAFKKGNAADTNKQQLHDLMQTSRICLTALVRLTCLCLLTLLVSLLLSSFLVILLVRKLSVLIISKSQKLVLWKQSKPWVSAKL